ncbi:hypothetical protein K438DRAFT_2066579 [Mycena galopus ATCC 62051]|nr:hypothetical protein K438DRAFT_2066579 [Mycena galopus ATCC 62051]
MISTRRATYEAPPPIPSYRRSLHQEAAEADAIPRGDMDSDSYWSGTESSGNSVSESAAVASSEGSASVLSGDSTKGESIDSPAALSIGSAGGRIESELSHSVVLSDLHSDAMLRISLPSMAIGPSSHNETGVSSGPCDALDFVAVSSVIPELDITSLPPMAIGTSSQNETGHLLSCAKAHSSASVSVIAAASFVVPVPDISSVVTAGDEKNLITAGTDSVSLSSIGPSSDTTYDVPSSVANPVVFPKRFAQHTQSSMNAGIEEASKFFPLWFRQSVEAGQDTTQDTVNFGADSDSDQSSREMRFGFGHRASARIVQENQEKTPEVEQPESQVAKCKRFRQAGSEGQEGAGP